MKSSSCIEGCLDVENPVDVRLIKLQEWAAKDKEFLKMLSNNNKNNHSHNQDNHLEKSLSSDPILYWSSPSPLISVVPSPGRDYAVRQRYLRSYTLDTTTDYYNKHKPMSPAQRAKNWLVNYQPSNKRSKKKQQRNKSAGTVTSSSNCNSFFRVVSSFLFVCADVKLDVLD